MFVTITGKTLREIGVDPNQGTFGEDHSYLAQHIAGRNFARIKWTKTPSNNLWVQLGDGGLACYTYHVEQQVKGWTSQLLAAGTDRARHGGAAEQGQLRGAVDGRPLADLGKLILRLSDPPSRLYMDVGGGLVAAPPTNVSAGFPAHERPGGRRAGRQGLVSGAGRDGGAGDAAAGGDWRRGGTSA